MIEIDSETRDTLDVGRIVDPSTAVLVVDSEGVVVHCTPSAAAVLRSHVEDIVGDFVEMLIPSDRRWSHRSYRMAFMADPEARSMDPALEPEALLPNGETLPIAVRLEPRALANGFYVFAHLSAQRCE